MSLKDSFNEALEVLDWIKVRFTLPEDSEDVKLLIDIAKASTAISSSMGLQDAVKRISESYEEANKPREPISFPTYQAPSEEEIREREWKETLGKIKQLEMLSRIDIRDVSRNKTCPLTLASDYPRQCIKEHCVWWDDPRNTCGMLP